MPTITTIIYQVDQGDQTLAFQLDGKPTGSSKISYQLQGDGDVDAVVTVKLQESNVFGSGHKDIALATAVANVNTTEYVGEFNTGGGYIYYDVTVGAATTGVLTITIRTS